MGLETYGSTIWGYKPRTYIPSRSIPAVTDRQTLPIYSGDCYALRKLDKMFKNPM